MLKLSLSSRDLVPRLHPIETHRSFTRPIRGPSTVCRSSWEQQQSAPAFHFFSSSSAALGALALGYPELLLKVILPAAATGGLDVPLLRMAGATMLISCAVEYSLKGAAENRRLASATYQRLSLGCGVKSLGYLAAFAQAHTLHNPLLWAFYPTMAAASALMNFTVLLQVASGSSMTSGMLPSFPRSLEAKLYACGALLCSATALACYIPAFCPWANACGSALGAVQGSTVGSFLLHTSAPGFFLASVSCLVLQDAADRGRLASSTFRQLNLGLAGLGGAHFLILLSLVLSGLAADNWTSPFLLVLSALPAVYCVSQYLAPRPT